MGTSSDPEPAASPQTNSEQLDAAWQAVIGSIAAARRDTGNPTGPHVGVTVLTGFLGSGKTTVLRQLLADPAGTRIAAVVNDIGRINIDAAVVGASTERDPAAASVVGERIELTNGCACCALVDDLAESLEGLAGAGVFDAIVVEASGVSDPATMAAAVEGAAGCRLDGVVAMVDAPLLDAQLDDARIGPAVRRQIDVAHLVALSKVDLVNAAEVETLTARISDIAPGRMVVPSAHGRIDPRILLSAAIRGATFGAVTHGHPFEVATATVPGAGPWEPAAVGRWFENQPEPLLRAKGWFGDVDGCWHELQVVGRSWSIKPAPSSPEAGIEPVVVLIGHDQSAVDRAAASLNGLR